MRYRSPRSIYPYGVVPAHSHKVSRVSWYSGSCHAFLPFVFGAFTLSGWLSPNHSTRLTRQFCSPNPGVHALRFGLFRVRSPLLTESHVVFSSSGYLDVLLGSLIDSAVRTPECTHSGLGSSAFARRYLRNRVFFLFLRVLRCFSYSCSPPYVMDWRMDT